MCDETPHPAFPPPGSDDVILWRYLDFEKFDWLVSNRRLFMPPAPLLGDPLEGTTPEGHSKWWDTLAETAVSEEQRQTFARNKDLLAAFAAQFRPRYYVSCWHMNPLENLEMWPEYTKSPDAVAVATSYGALRISLPAYVEIGVVRYIDYANERLPSLNLFEAITHKNISWCREREVRAVAYPPAGRTPEADHFQANHFAFEAQEEFVFFAPEIDIARLIHRVVLHPKSSPEFAGEIQAICEKSGLPRPEPSTFAC